MTGSFKTIGVIGAMPEEVDLISAAIDGYGSEVYAGVRYHRGSRAGRRLVVCCGGMGKVNAASTTQVLITKFGADAIFFCGVAGNMSREIGIGDVVISREVCHHDADERMMSQSAPHTALYPADPLLRDAAERGCRHTGTRYIAGRIATGDQFVGDAETKRMIAEKCRPDCVEMEGAGVGQVAMRNGIPFVIIRAMSDNAADSIESLGAETFDISAYVRTSSAILLAAIDALGTPG
jgi:adenosylhomocysteine nucleosidase